jgi:hypothetical protein
MVGVLEKPLTARYSFKLFDSKFFNKINGSIFICSRSERMLSLVSATKLLQIAIRSLSATTESNEENRVQITQQSRCLTAFLTLLLATFAHAEDPTPRRPVTAESTSRAPVSGIMSGVLPLAAISHREHKVR